jgi:release factor glutamine methyltransferase
MKAQLKTKVKNVFTFLIKHQTSKIKHLFSYFSAMFVKDNTLNAAKAYFFERLEGFSESELKSMWTEIICKRFNWSRADLLINTDFRLSESDLLYIRSYVKRLQENEPFQYIIGETEFFGLTIKCDKRALIPRPETEELVDWISENSNIEKVLDICSGSGCIALALKSIYKNATVFGVDISQEANELARENSQLNQLDVKFAIADALDLNASFWQTLSDIDVIVSNPPYIPESEQTEMSPNVVDFEPHIALFVENDSPIIFYQRIADLAIKKLKVGGFLYFELHHLYSKEVKSYLEQIGLQSIEIKKDLQGKNRMIRGERKK